MPIKRLKNLLFLKLPVWSETVPLQLIPVFMRFFTVTLTKTTLNEDSVGFWKSQLYILQIAVSVYAFFKMSLTVHSSCFPSVSSHLEVSKCQCREKRVTGSKCMNCCIHLHYRDSCTGLLRPVRRQTRKTPCITSGLSGLDKASLLPDFCLVKTG